MRAAGAILLVALLLAAGLLATLLWFPGPLLRAGLRAAGLETVAFEDLRLGRSSLELSGLQIGAPADHRLANLQIHYRLGDLLRGRVESIEIAGLELRGRLVDGRIELAGFETQGEPGAPAGFDVLPWPRKVVLRAAEVQLATPWGELRLPLAAELQPGAAETKFRVEVTGGRLISDAGHLLIDVSLHGQAPLDRALTLADVAASGEATIAAESFAVPQVAERIDGQSKVTLALAGGRLDARLGPALIDAGSLAAPLAALSEPLPPPWRLRVGDDTAPLHVTAALNGATVALQVEGALDLAAGRARVGGDVAASVAIEEMSRLGKLAGRASLSLEQLRWQKVALERGQLELAGEGTPAQGRGTVDLDLAGGGQPIAGLMLEGVTLRHHLSAAFADRRLTVAAREAGALTAQRAAWRDTATTGPLALRLEPADQPLFTATFEAGGGIAWQHHLAARGAASDLTVGAATPLGARAEIADLDLALSGAADGLRAGRVSVAGGKLALPALQLSLEGIRTKVALAADGLAADQAIPLTVATISHGGTPAWFAPLALSATLRPAAERIAFDARLERPADGLALTVSGRHDLAAARGRAEVKLAPLAFAPGQRQPGRLAPVLGEMLEDVTGTVALDGTLRWGARDPIAADLAVLVENLAFSAGPARFSQVDGVVRIDQLWPLTTPPGQQLAIGLLDLGLPLTRGLVAFQLRPDQTLAVERLRWSFAGGTVSAAPFTVGSAASDILVTLTAERLDLAQLFALTKLDGLSGEGTIRGSLPVRISGTEALIEGGELEASGPGWLRYRPEAAPTALQAGGENVSLLLQALENFHYEALRITLDGRTDAEMDIGLHVQGANPTLYGGYPIEFNLNLEGELANILRSGLASYQIPERIREQMQGFRR